MQATAQLQIIPVGDGVSVRAEIARVLEVLRDCDLTVEPGPSGTDLQGELGTILDAVEKVHGALHHAGSVRLVSFLKLETRTDKAPTLAGKRL